MKIMYANLLGTWTNLNEKNAIIEQYGPAQKWIQNQRSTLYDFPYIHITIDDVDYQISTSDIQIITK